MLVDARYALHVIFTPCLRYMPNLNLDYLCSIFAEVGSREFVNELLHYQAALVLNKEGLDPLLLVSAQLIGKSQKLGDCFFDG